jgi:two-component system chemotaxis response regulator CheY
MSSVTILVADDDRFVRELLKDALAPLGHRIIEAKDGDEAVSRVGSDHPEVVMLDLVMPRRSGMEALEEIRRIAPACRVLVVSSLETESLRQSALASGAVGFVVKPFHPLEITDAVRRALEQARG